MSGRIKILNVFELISGSLMTVIKAMGRAIKTALWAVFDYIHILKKLTVNHIRKYPQIPY